MRESQFNSKRSQDSYLIFIWRTESIFWDSLDVHEHWITLYGRYSTWIIGFYHFKIILIESNNSFFNILFFALLHSGIWEKCKRFTNKSRYAKRITPLNNWMTSTKHGVNVIWNMFHPIRANVRRNTQFINGVKMLQALCASADYWDLGSVQSWNPMLYHSICDI